MFALSFIYNTLCQKVYDYRWGSEIIPPLLAEWAARSMV